MITLAATSVVVGEVPKQMLLNAPGLEWQIARRVEPRDYGCSPNRHDDVGDQVLVEQPSDHVTGDVPVVRVLGWWRLTVGDLGHENPQLLGEIAIEPAPVARRQVRDPVGEEVERCFLDVRVDVAVEALLVAESGVHFEAGECLLKHLVGSEQWPEDLLVVGEVDGAQPGDLESGGERLDLVVESLVEIQDRQGNPAELLCLAWIWRSTSQAHLDIGGEVQDLVLLDVDAPVGPVVVERQVPRQRFDRSWWRQSLQLLRLSEDAVAQRPPDALRVVEADGVVCRSIITAEVGEVSDLDWVPHPLVRVLTAPWGPRPVGEPVSVQCLDDVDIG